MRRFRRLLAWFPFCGLLFSLATAFTPDTHSSPIGLVGCEFFPEHEQADTTGQGGSCPTGPEH